MNIIAAAELRFESTTVVQLRPTKMTGPKIRIGGPVGTGPHTTVANNGQQKKDGDRRMLFPHSAIS